METERNQTSGSITFTYYTIYGLQTNTSYNIIVSSSSPAAGAPNYGQAVGPKHVSTSHFHLSTPHLYSIYGPL